MGSWEEFAVAVPDLASRVLACFEPYKHHTMATIRADGGPWISGTEVEFVDGDIVLGMMPGTRRAADLRRDPRLALHSHSVDPPEVPTAWTGEAKLAGTAVEIPNDDHDRFRIDIAEVVRTYLNDAGDKLVVESWRAGRGVQTAYR